MKKLIEELGLEPRSIWSQTYDLPLNHELELYEEREEQQHSTK